MHIYVYMFVRVCIKRETGNRSSTAFVYAVTRNAVHGYNVIADTPEVPEGVLLSCEARSRPIHLFSSSLHALSPSLPLLSLSSSLVRSTGDAVYGRIKICPPAKYFSVVALARSRRRFFFTLGYAYAYTRNVRVYATYIYIRA